MANGENESLPAARARSRIDIRIPARAESVRRARTALEDLGLPSDVFEDVRLMVSELVTNSVVHSGLGPRDEIRVRADWSGSTLRATVSDGPRDSEHVVIVGSIRPVPGSESGWGLFFVNELADRWGTDIDEAISYWFEIQVKADPPG
jgi:anti-sigma regulatory factor (Ser/Thr protein kinase)